LKDDIGEAVTVDTTGSGNGGINTRFDFRRSEAVGASFPNTTVGLRGNPVCGNNQIFEPITIHIASAINRRSSEVTRPDPPKCKATSSHREMKGE
jgi:hypothetical protein